jgi:DNA polymerase III epsilon subunit family exonuclease
MLPSDAFLQSLNKKQQIAVSSPLQPTAVLAGPGTGKTRVLVARIFYLIEHFDIPPESILALTFTNKAAIEMKNRLYELNNEKGKKVYTSTIHGFALNVLRKYFDRAGLHKHFTVCDSEYQFRLVRNIYAPFIRENLDSKAKAILISFSNYSTREKNISAFTRERYNEYVRHLNKHNLIDFDQIVMKCRDLLKNHSDILSEYQQSYLAILVDEFQDTDKVQYELLKMLGLKRQNIFIVADDDQSIYAWRGACPENIREFIQDFNISAPIFLDENYRNGNRILTSANMVIQSTDRILPNKKVQVKTNQKNDVELRLFLTEKGETDFIIQKIRNWAAAGIPFGEIALIYPQHKVGHILEQVLLKEQIPYQMASGRSLLDNPIVYKLIAYLRVVRDPEDDLALDELSRSELGSFLHSMIKQRSMKRKTTFRKALYDFYRFGDQRVTVESKLKIKNFISHIANLINLKSFYNFNNFIDEIYSISDQQKSSFLIRMQPSLEDVFEIPEQLAITADNFEGKTVTVVHPNEQIRYLASKLFEAVTGFEVHQREGARMVLLIDDQEIPIYKLISDRRKGSLSALFRFLQWYAVRKDSELSDFIVLDIETTDQDIEQCGIVEFAAVRVRENIIVDRFSSLINPERAISKEAQQIHHIRERDIKDAPSIEHIWPEIKKFLGEDILIAHNGYGFDFPILDRFAKKIEGEKLTNVKLDSLVLARSLYPEQSNSIDALMERYSLQCSERHRALQDVEVLTEIYKRLRKHRSSLAGKTALEMYLDYVALGNYLENIYSATEDRIFFIGGTRKLGSPYSKILVNYCSRFNIEQKLLIKKIKECLQHIIPQVSSYQDYEQLMLKIKNLTSMFISLPMEEAIEKFLSYIALSSSQDDLEEINAISLLTYYAAKGLEFDKVFLLGMENENMPNFFALHKSSDDDRSITQKMEEQKRLFYVGLTRAKTEVILTVVKNRGGWQRESSPFLKNLKIPYTIME